MPDLPDDTTQADAKPLTRAEHLARAKAAFNIIQAVRINGPLRSATAFAAYLGLPKSGVGLAKLEEFGRACQRADISRGSSYVGKGLVYGLEIYHTDLGYRVRYAALCKTGDP